MSCHDSVTLVGKIGDFGGRGFIGEAWITEGLKEDDLK